MYRVWNQVKAADGRAGVVIAIDGKEPQEAVVVRFDDGKEEEVKLADLQFLGD